MSAAPPHDQADEVTDVVDDRDVVIGRATRREVRARKLLHRGVAYEIWQPWDERRRQERSR